MLAFYFQEPIILLQSCTPRESPWLTAELLPPSMWETQQPDWRMSRDFRPRWLLGDFVRLLSCGSSITSPCLSLVENDRARERERGRGRGREEPFWFCVIFTRLGGGLAVNISVFAVLNSSQRMCNTPWSQDYVSMPAQRRRRWSGIETTSFLYCYLPPGLFSTSLNHSRHHFSLLSQNDSCCLTYISLGSFAAGTSGVVYHSVWLCNTRQNESIQSTSLTHENKVDFWGYL